MFRKLTVAILMTLTFAACAKQEPKTVDYYLQHKAERQTLLAKAYSNPGKYRNDADVINADAAQSREQMQDWTKKGTRRVYHLPDLH